jgi:hypothetical protein
MKKFWTYIIVLLLITTGCSNTSSVESGANLQNTNTLIPQSTSNTLNNTMVPTPARSSYILNTIDLAFRPHEIKPLIEGTPDERWIKGNSIYYGDLLGQKEATISFYWDNQTDNQPDIDPDTLKYIYAYLEAGGKVYNLGLISYFGFDEIGQVELVDLTNDGIKDFLITGNAGATCETAWVIGYKDDNWYCLLDYSNLSIHDLDEDGRQELTATSMGSLPPFVEIFRWNENRFESTNVATNTKMIYARLYDKNGRWIIESGNVKEQYYYMYKDGKLNQILLDEE